MSHVCTSHMVWIFQIFLVYSWVNFNNMCFPDYLPIFRISYFLCSSSFSINTYLYSCCLPFAFTPPSVFSMKPDTRVSVSGTAFPLPALTLQTKRPVCITACLINTEPWPESCIHFPWCVFALTFVLVFRVSQTVSLILICFSFGLCEWLNCTFFFPGRGNLA